MAETSKADYLAVRSRLDKDGGPAFPAEHYETEHGTQVFVTGGHGGMSLRDWFAGQALAGWLAGWPADAVNLPDQTATAARAYAYADAMLTQREGQNDDR